MPRSLSSLLGRVESSAPVTIARTRINTGSAYGRMGGTLYRISPSYFQQLRELASDFRNDSTKVMFAIDRAVAGYAAVCMGYAQKRSHGFLDPQERNPQWAWKIPVRRITGKYYTGWKVAHIGLGTWRTYNDSREAYYIEFGINHAGTGITGPNGVNVRIRRPILKLSIMDTVAFVRGTELDWLEFRGAFSLSTHHSPITGMSEEAATATIRSGEGFIIGAINTQM